MLNKSLLPTIATSQKQQEIDEEFVVKQEEIMKKTRSDTLKFQNIFAISLQVPRTSSFVPNIQTITVIQHYPEVKSPVNRLNQTMSKAGKTNIKQRKKIVSDYRKNICGYISKKAIRQFVSPAYLQKTLQLCHKYGVDYNQAKSYYMGKIQLITGPSHLPDLVVPKNKSQARMKKAFKEFYEWFLKERYLRYLLNDGKMADRRAYIQYKNNVLLETIKCKNIDFPPKLEEPEGMDIKIHLQPFSAIQIPASFRTAKIQQ